MNIRAKIVLVVLPLIITPLIFTGVISSLSARNGITSVATQFLLFKTEELTNYAEGQWSLLTENELDTNPAFVEAAMTAVESFARGLVRSDTELIFAMDENGTVAMSTSAIDLTDRDREMIGMIISEGNLGWQSVSVGGAERVANIARFEPLGWYIFVTEERETFYEAINQIVYQTAVILAVSIGISLVLLLLFAGYLTMPLRSIVTTMTDIIKTNDLSQRVEVLYRDETGRLGHTFNVMVAELQNAYSSIKGYALRAVVAQTKEQKIRNIFQKYVPADVIEQFFTNPESMLVGENRVLSVLFSDIRDFTTISEALRPDEMVESLNQYFTLMVDSIMSRRGIVDKYIGDAIMAFFGAPVKREDDAYQSVLAGLDMVDTLRDFNIWQQRRGRPEFRIGIGINYGAVTVGNIGTEKKMDYTVIGDMVNLASRIEGLTKKYKQPLIVSETVYRKIRDSLPCRLLDKVVVKGRSAGVGIYSVKRKLQSIEEDSWGLHNEAMKFYYQQEFDKALQVFAEIHDADRDDRPAAMMAERCRELVEQPPGRAWTGVVEMTEK